MPPTYAPSGVMLVGSVPTCTVRSAGFKLVTFGMATRLPASAADVPTSTTTVAKHASPSFHKRTAFIRCTSFERGSCSRSTSNTRQDGANLKRLRYPSAAVQAPAAPGNLSKRHDPDVSTNFRRYNNFLAPPKQSQDSWKSGRETRCMRGICLDSVPRHAFQRATGQSGGDQFRLREQQRRKIPSWVSRKCHVFKGLRQCSGSGQERVECLSKDS